MVRGLILLAFVLLVGVPAGAAEAPPPVGEEVALAHLAAGMPPMLYSYKYDTRLPGYRNPGLAGCDRRPSTSGPVIFVPLPAANYGEGTSYSPAEWMRARAVVNFAAHYNQTVFRTRKAQVLAICPHTTAKDGHDWPGG